MKKNLYINIYKTIKRIKYIINKYYICVPMDIYMCIIRDKLCFMRPGIQKRHTDNIIMIHECKTCTFYNNQNSRIYKYFLPLNNRKHFFFCYLMISSVVLTRYIYTNLSTNLRYRLLYNLKSIMHFYFCKGHFTSIE